MITSYLFYILSAIAILSAIQVVRVSNPIYSVLYLIVTFFAIAGHYVLMNAQFLAAVHVMVYAGAIMVLFLYVIMMLNLNKETEPHKPALVKAAAIISGGVLLVVLVASLKGAEVMIMAPNADRNIGLVENLGKTLFNQFLLPFEVSSILFLGAMVGAVMIGKKEAK